MVPCSTSARGRACSSQPDVELTTSKDAPPLGSDQGLVLRRGWFPLPGPRVRELGGQETALPTWEQAVEEDWLGRWAMNLMVINVSTRKFRRAVRLPEGDIPAVGRKKMIGVDADHAVARTGAGGGKDAVNPTDRVNWLRRGHTEGA
jgi:hypothetical protein